MNSQSSEYYENKWQLKNIKLVVQTKTSNIYKANYKNKDVILKQLTDIGRIHEAPGAIALSHWTSGAVELIDHDEGAHLLDFVPGDNLEKLVKGGNDKLVPEIICNTLNKIHITGVSSKNNIMSLNNSFKSLIKRAQESPACPSYIRAGYEIAMELFSSPKDEVLLHGDIHHNNIMQRSDGEWVVIDPKCLWGERAYDYANCFYNPDGDPEIVENKKRILFYASAFAENLNQPVSRVLKFAYAHGALSVSWEMDRGRDGLRRQKIMKLIMESLN